MNKFRKPHGSGGDRGGFGKPSIKPGFKPNFDRPRFGSRPEQRGFNKEKFDAMCSHCGKPCQVPFRPNGKKPVYCSACFNSERGGSTPISRDQAPTTFSPRPSVPNVPPAEDRRIDDMKRKLDSIDSKLDTILRLVAAPTEAITKSVEIMKPAEQKKKSIARKK